MSAVYLPMSKPKKIFSRLCRLHKQYIYFSSHVILNFMLFHAKMGILGKYLYLSHTLFILYLEGNHTLFRDKLYFIWKFSSGNTVYLPAGQVKILSFVYPGLLTLLYSNF